MDLGVFGKALEICPFSFVSVVPVVDYVTAWEAKFESNGVIKKEFGIINSFLIAFGKHVKLQFGG